MDLTDRDRKILWTRAGNRCSYHLGSYICDRTLSLTESGKDIVVGQECHIVGEKEGAARYIADFPEREAYSNAILLCPIHHKLIDDGQTRDEYSVQLLRAMKQRHEETVRGLQNRVAITDSDFSIEAEDVDRALGMDITSPTTLSNVKVSLKASNAREAIGVRTNQPLTSALIACSACGVLIPLAYTGIAPASICCPHCGHLQRLDRYSD